MSAESTSFQVLETCWQLADGNGRIALCVIGTDGGPGLVVRAGYAVDDYFRVGRVSDQANARHLAEIWFEAALAHGFSEVSAEA